MRYRIPDNISTRYVYDSEQVRALDAQVMAAGTPGRLLMYRAGLAAFDRLRARWPQVRAIAVLCGAGNNGGDGYVLARLARERGWQVQVFATRDPAQLAGDAAYFAATYQQAGGVVQTLAEGELPVTDAALWVDALLGTGIRGSLSSWHQQLIQALNDSGRPLLALDLPSGLSADSGAPCPVAVRAQATVTFVGLKRGLFTAFGPDHCGTLFFDNLGIAPHHYREFPAALEVIAPPFAWRARKPSTHKGDTGSCLILGGQRGMTGAALIAGEAAARSGAGITRVILAAPPALNVAVRPELMVAVWAAEDEIEPWLEQADVLVAGPGLGEGELAQHWVQSAWHSAHPLVLDADGLNVLAQHLAQQQYRPRSAPLILTPHPGEAARLLGCSTADIQHDRFQAARQLAQQFHALVVLKGVGTLIARPSGECQLLMAGNPGMASGGMGDLLSGILGALLSQGLDAWQATRLGVWLHATAADRVAETQGEAGLLALDLLPEVRRLMQQLAQ